MLRLNYNENVKMGRGSSTSDLFTPKFTGDLIRPSTEGSVKLVVKPFGACRYAKPVKDANGNFIPTVAPGDVRMPLMDDDGVLTPWIVPLNIVSSVGTVKKVSFIANRKVQDPETGEEYLTLEKNKMPYGILYNAWFKYKEQYPAYEALGKYNKQSKTAASLSSYARPRALFQGAMFQNSRTSDQDPEMSVHCIVQLSTTARESLEDVVTEQHVRSDLVLPTGTQCITFKGGPGGTSYIAQVEELPQFANAIASTNEALTQRRMFQPWEDILKFYTYDEMAEMLVEAFSDVPELLKYAFGTTHAEWLPESILRGTVYSTPAPQAPAPQAPAPQAPAPQQSPASQQAPAAVDQNGSPDVFASPEAPPTEVPPAGDPEDSAFMNAMMAKLKNAAENR